jgi:hypothetical protein
LLTDDSVFFSTWLTRAGKTGTHCCCYSGNAAASVARYVRADCVIAMVAYIMATVVLLHVLLSFLGRAVGIAEVNVGARPMVNKIKPFVRPIAATGSSKSTMGKEYEVYRSKPCTQCSRKEEHLKHNAEKVVDGRLIYEDASPGWDTNNQSITHRQQQVLIIPWNIVDHLSPNHSVLLA